jgi:hypothetical protein
MRETVTPEPLSVAAVPLPFFPHAPKEPADETAVAKEKHQDGLEATVRTAPIICVIQRVAHTFPFRCNSTGS